MLLFIKKRELNEHNLDSRLSYQGELTQATARIITFLGLVTHSYVSITFQCGECGGSLAVLYDFGEKNGSRKGGGKGRAEMYYPNPWSQTPFPLSRQMSYNQAFYMYDRMPSPAYNALFYNCQHWADAFAKRIVKRFT